MCQPHAAGEEQVEVTNLNVLKRFQVPDLQIELARVRKGQANAVIREWGELVGLKKRDRTTRRRRRQIQRLARSLPEVPPTDTPAQSVVVDVPQPELGSHVHVVAQVDSATDGSGIRYQGALVTKVVGEERLDQIDANAADEAAVELAARAAIAALRARHLGHVG